MNTYTNTRTGYSHTDLTAVVNASTIGDTITYGGTPAFIVRSASRLDFITAPKAQKK